MVIVVYPLEGFTLLAAPFIAIKCRVSGRPSPRTSLLGTSPVKVANGKRQWYSSGFLSQEKPLPRSYGISKQCVNLRSKHVQSNQVYVGGDFPYSQIPPDITAQRHGCCYFSTFLLPVT